STASSLRSTRVHSREGEMALTDRQRNTIVAALRSKAPNACPMCSSRNWTLGDELVGTMSASLQGGMAIGGPYIPMVQVVCNGCGFVAHYAVGVLGIKLE